VRIALPLAVIVFSWSVHAQEPAAAAAPGQSARWAALFAAVPALPTDIAAARRQVDLRRIGKRIRVEVSDPGLRAVQRNADTLFAATAWQSALQIRDRLAQLPADPQAQHLAGRIDATLHGKDGAGGVPTMAELADLDALIQREMDADATVLADAEQSEIGAYRLELQRAEPRPGSFIQELFEQQRRYAQAHADADRAALERLPAADAAVLSGELVETHRALARQQLRDAAALVERARATLAPRFERMAQLAQAAEAQDAPVSERNVAYAQFWNGTELLLTLERETLEDVGFWASVDSDFTAAAAGRLLVIAEFPDVALHADGTIDTISAHYPAGRDFVIGRPPGIR